MWSRNEKVWSLEIKEARGDQNFAILQLARFDITCSYPYRGKNPEERVGV